MFKFAHKRQVWWPVAIKAPKDDGSGDCEEHVIKVLYELMTITESRQQESLTPEEQSAVLRDKVKGWQDVCDAAGEPIDFSHDTLAAVLDVPYIERAIALGLLQATIGAPAKN